jgi:MOSC domain-containing protein YiiM
MQEPMTPHWRAGIFGEIVEGGTIRLGDEVAFEGL